jgi:hypothetical protein
MWPIQLAFLLFSVCGTFLSSLTYMYICKKIRFLEFHFSLCLIFSFLRGSNLARCFRRLYLFIYLLIHPPSHTSASRMNNYNMILGDKIQAIQYNSRVKEIFG